MKNELIYGQKPDMETANYVELTIRDKNKLDVIIGYKGEPTVWHLIMKNPDKYEAFKAELIKSADECEDDIWELNDLIQAEDIHDDYELEYYLDGLKYTVKRIRELLENGYEYYYYTSSW
jgi:hypothetical protein